MRKKSKVLAVKTPKARRAVAPAKPAATGRMSPSSVRVRPLMVAATAA